MSLTPAHFHENDSNNVMADDYFSDSDEAKEETPDTALLPKSFFGEKEPKPGDKCQVRIEELYEDEVSVSYVKHKKEEKEPEPEPKPTPEPRDDMAELME